MQNTEMWTVLHVPSAGRLSDVRPRGGHKLFRSNIDGQVAIADWSGVYPENTDDGILYVSKLHAVRVFMSKLTPALRVELAVWSIRHQRTMTVPTNIPTMQAVLLSMPELSVELDADLVNMLQVLLPYVKLARPEGGGDVP